MWDYDILQGYLWKLKNFLKIKRITTKHKIYNLDDMLLFGKPE